MIRHPFLFVAGIVGGVLFSLETGKCQDASQSPSSGVPLVLRIDLENEVISPGIARYVLRAIDEAESRNAECLIITLDTPGGLLESTRQIVKRFLQSRVCVVVYVAPTGARAASAGVFITMAAHVAAMAPATTIGAARPVAIGGFSPFGPAREEEAGDRQLRDRNEAMPFAPLSVPGSWGRDLGFAAYFPSPEWALPGARVLWDSSPLTSKLLPKANGLGVWLPLRGLGVGENGQPIVLVGEGVPATEVASDKPTGTPEAAPPSGASAAKDEASSESKPSGEAAREAGKDSPAERPRSQDEKRAANNGRDTTPMEEKIINDTVSWAQALAKQRGRNAEWIAKAVRESSSVTAEEAVANDVVDFLAEDFAQLLEKLDGRTIKLPYGDKTLRVRGAVVEKIEMWWGERILSIISHPQVAFLLLLFGVYGVLYELFSPGWGVPGTVGLICLLLGLFGLSVLPVNYLGLALLIVAVGLFVAEAYVPSFGLLSLGGVICMTLGALMLIDSPPGFTDIPLPLVLGVSVATALVFLIIVGATVRAHQRQVLTGDESLVGRTVQAKTDFRFVNGRYEGKVLFEGEWWTACSNAPVAQGQTCRILSRDGLTLWVAPEAAEAGKA